MVNKRLAKSKSKSLGPKISLAKLSNKKLNKLGRQGKLKKSRFGKKKLVALIKERTGKAVKPQADGSHLEKKRVDPDEIPLEEADYEYYAKPGRDFSFLNSLSKPGKSKRRTVADDGSFDAVEGSKYGARCGQVGEKRVQTKSMLPIKSKEKGVEAREINVDSNDEDEERKEEGMEEVDDGATAADDDDDQQLPDSTVQTFAERELTLAQSRQIIALLCTAIIEAPETNVNKLGDLRQMLGDVDGTVPVDVRKLTILSMLEVFKDIIPSYRIRILTQTEKKQSMKKETKQLNTYEDLLVSHYRYYLETLEFIITGKAVDRKDKKKKRKLMALSSAQAIELTEQQRESLSEISLKCLCDLLNTHPHFNFRTNIISLIVRFINHRNPKLSDMVCECVKKVFGEDKSGDSTLEVVRLIGRVVKVRNFNVQPKVLKTFLSLKIKEIEAVDAQHGKKRRTREQKYKETSRKDRKRDKRFEYLEKELHEFSVEDDKKKRLRLHTEIINIIFLTYFRILKHARRSTLLSTVLEGLAKFAHLINVTFFDDLFTVLTELVDDGDLTYREGLHCIQTALTLLMGHGAALNIDPQRFYIHLYRTLFNLHIGSPDEDVTTALHCLDIVINKRRRQVSHERMLAFTKRLSTLTLQMNCDGALALLAVVRSIMQDYPKADVLLETESYGSGMYLPEVEDPDHSNSHNTALYELLALSRSYHPSVCKYAEHILHSDVGRHKQLPQDLARKSPFELFKSSNPKGLVCLKKSFPKTKQSKQQRAYLEEQMKDLSTTTTLSLTSVDNSSVDIASSLSASEDFLTAFRTTRRSKQ